MIRLTNRLTIAENKHSYSKCRIFTMEAMKVALNVYSETMDNRFLEHAKVLGGQSLWYKKELEKLK